MNHSPFGWTDVLGRSYATTSAFAIAAILALQLPTAVMTSTAASAKTPGKTYCFFGHCHRVRTLDETRRAIGVSTQLKASFYDDPKSDRYNPSNVTSSGEWFRSDKPDNAASPIWPDGTKILLWNPSNKRTAVVRINNAGPYWGPRQLDVSRATAEKLGFVKSGVATLQTKVLAAPTPAESTYRKGRQYASVPGYMGVFETIDHALLEAGRSVHKIFTSPVAAIAGRDVTGTSAKPVAQAKPAIKVAAAQPEQQSAEVKAETKADAKAGAKAEAKRIEIKDKAKVAEAKADAKRADAKEQAKREKAQPMPTKELMEIEKVEADAAKDVLKASRTEAKPRPSPKSKAAQSQSIPGKQASVRSSQL